MIYQQFFDWFHDFENSYVVIGGNAAAILLANDQQQFRHTQDYDIVVIFEHTSAAFATCFMAFVNEYHYELADYGVGVVQQKVYYRFQLPKLEINTRPIVPRQIELFSRLPINYQLKFETATTPLHFDNGPSLSAIILDDSYYELLKNNVQHLNQMPILNAAALIFFKANAHLDIIARQAAGQKIKHRADTSKHFKDVCRLTSLLPVNGFDPLAVPKDCQHDLQHFIMLLVKEDAMIFKRRFRANRDFNLTQAEVVTNLRGLLP